LKPAIVSRSIATTAETSEDARARRNSDRHEPRAEVSGRHVHGEPVKPLRILSISQHLHWNFGSGACFVIAAATNLRTVVRLFTMIMTSAHERVSSNLTRDL
jgi:hypothetical protein